MKSSKRQNRSREQSEVETEQVDTNDRKKAKLSAGQDVSSRKRESRNGEQTNGDSDSLPILDHINAFVEPKTSTPINLNGASSTLNFQNNSFEEPNLFDSSEITTENIILENNSKEVEMSEDGDKDAESVGTSSISQFSENVQEVDKNLEMPKLTEEVPVHTSDSEEKSTEKCDVDIFSSSLLQTYELTGHAENVLAVIAEGDMIISASQDTTIKVWDTYKKEEKCNCQGHTGSVNAIVLLTAEQSANISSKMNFDAERILISGSTDCYIRLWSIPSGVELHSIYTFNGINSLVYMPDQNIVAVGTDGGKLELWDIVSSKVLHSVIAHDGVVSDIKVDGSHLYTASFDGKVKVWLLDEEDLIPIYSRTRKNAMPNGKMVPTEWKCIAAQEGLMYLGDNTCDIKLLDWQAGRLRSMKNQIQPDGITDAMFIRKDVLLSSAFDAHKYQGAINVWQLPSLTYICTMSGEVGKIMAITLTELENNILRLVTGGSQLIVWDFHSTKPKSPDPNEKFFCQELDRIGEDTSLKSIEQSTIASANVSEVDGRPRGWKCVLF